jgi:hypothetical protein
MIGATVLREGQRLAHPAAVLNRIGQGAVAYIPCNVFRDFTRSRYPLARVFIHDVMRALAGRMDIEVKAPACVDVVLRRRGPKTMVHFINRASGIPNLPNSGVIDEIPPVSPLTVLMRLPRRPRSVRLAFEKAKLGWTYRGGKNGGRLEVDVSQVHIHAAVVVEE